MTWDGIDNDIFLGGGTGLDARQADGTNGVAAGGLTYSSDGVTVTLTLLEMEQTPGNVVQGTLATPRGGSVDRLTTMQLTIIPIPAALPMFGAALFSLAGIGFARRKIS